MLGHQRSKSHTQTGCQSVDVRVCDRIALEGSDCHAVQNVQPARFLHRKVHIPNWTEVVPSADRACPYGTFEACHESLVEAPSLDSLGLDFCELGGSGTCASGQPGLGP